MNPDPVQRYISSLNGSSKKDAGLDVTSLDILEQFAWEKYLSAYQICSNLKSTHLKLAYKNVNKRTNALLSSGLIQETEVEGISNKHRAKYYRLTEYGIYQLFLNRLNSLLINPSDVRKRRELSPVPNAQIFLRNYSDSFLFKTFLYAYFEKETLLAIGPSLLDDIYGYLSSCCHSIERNLKYSKLGDIPIIEKICSWNRIPGKDNEVLLSHLKQMFNLESVSPYNIKKENNSITVNTPSAPIVIKLDKAENRVRVMSTAGGQFKELEYDVNQLGQEMVVSKRIPSEESIKDIVNDAEKQIEQLIYEFVYHLASSATEASKEFSYYCEILSKDVKFMSVVEKINENRHKGFEKGYKKLTNTS